MINIDLISNIQDRFSENINSKDEVKYTENSEVKDDFKSFLKKEVKKDIKKEDKSVDLNRETEDLKNTEKPETKEIKETLETSLEKIKEVIDGNYNGDDIEVEDIIEVINLLSNLLVTGDLKGNIEVNVEELIDSNLLVEGDLDDIKNLLPQVKEVVSISEEGSALNLDNKGFKEVVSILEEGSDLKLDDKDFMENLKSLSDLINNMLETGKDSTEINLDKESLNKEILNLLNSISEKDVENFKLPENQSNIKEIISSLVNIKNYNENVEVVEEPITLDKEDLNLKDNIKINIESNNLQSENDNSEFGNSLKGNTGEEVSEEIKEEDKILSKFIGDDNKGTFGNVLTSYDRFKNNSVEFIQNPEIINSQTMDDDIIKSVKYMMKNNIEELTVKIYPKELGELTIKILSEEGIMKAEIKATSKEAYSILNANIAEIKNSLSEQNIKIQDVQVSIYNDDTTFFSGKEDSRENEKNSSNSNSKVDSINLDENEELVIEDRIESNVNLLA